jgi:hypothetical protein
VRVAMFVLFPDPSMPEKVMSNGRVLDRARTGSSATGKQESRRPPCITGYREVCWDWRSTARLPYQLRCSHQPKHPSGSEMNETASAWQARGRLQPVGKPQFRSWAAPGRRPHLEVVATRRHLDSESLRPPWSVELVAILLCLVSAARAPVA